MKEKKGLRKAVLDGFIHYLKVVLDEGQSDLLDFYQMKQRKFLNCIGSQQILKR